MNDELAQLEDGGEEAVAELFSKYRDQLELMVTFRMDARLKERIDPTDVLQEAYIEVARRIGDYTSRPDVSFYVWIRQLTFQALINQHRRHFREKRSVGNQVARTSGNATSHSIVGMLAASQTTPGGAAMRAEERELLHQALESMDDVDREVLALRHFESLGNNQVAEVLGLSVTAASNRYVRAMTRLGQIMEKLNK